MSCGLEYFILDNVDSRNFSIYTRNVGNSLVRNFLVSKNLITETSPLFDGARFFNAKYGVRRIKLSVVVNENLDTATLRYFAGWINQKIPRKLVLSTEPYKYYYAITESEVDLDQIQNNGLFELEFVCNDPYGYSRFLSTDTIDYNNGIYYNSGIPYKDIYETLCPSQDFANPSTFTNITTSTNVELYCGANTDETVMNIKITGSCDDITITNNSTRESCSYGALSNNVLEIDGNYANVYKDSVMDNDTFEGDFIKLNGIGKNFDFDSNGKLRPVLNDGVNNISITGTNLNLSEVAFIYEYKYI